MINYSVKGSESCIQSFVMRKQSVVFGVHLAYPVIIKDVESNILQVVIISCRAFTDRLKGIVGMIDPGTNTGCTPIDGHIRKGVFNSPEVGKPGGIKGGDLSRVQRLEGKGRIKGKGFERIGFRNLQVVPDFFRGRPIRSGVSDLLLDSASQSDKCKDNKLLHDNLALPDIDPVGFDDRIRTPTILNDRDDGIGPWVVVWPATCVFFFDRIGSTQSNTVSHIEPAFCKADLLQSQVKSDIQWSLSISSACSQGFDNGGHSRAGAVEDLCRLLKLGSCRVKDDDVIVILKAIRGLIKGRFVGSFTVNEKILARDSVLASSVVAVPPFDRDSTDPFGIDLSGADGRGPGERGEVNIKNLDRVKCHRRFGNTSNQHPQEDDCKADSFHQSLLYDYRKESGVVKSLIRRERCMLIQD